jgi:hypothetical protein
MANVRMTGAALLATVTTTAETLTNAVEAVGASTKMLNNFVNNARSEQEMRIKAGAVSFKDRLMSEQTVAVATSRKTMEEYISQNPGQTDLCKEIWTKLEEALA